MAKKQINIQIESCEEMYASEDGISGLRVIKKKLQQIKKISTEEVETELDDLLSFVDQEIEEDES